MKRVVIDARESGTSTGRYADRLVEYLHKTEPPHNITVLTKPHRVDYLKSVAPNFKIVATRYKEFSFGEQVGLLFKIKGLRPDLVHFTMVQQPILYPGKAVTTMHDLTTARFRNPAKNSVVFTIKQQVYKFVNWLVPHKSRLVITPSNYVKQDVAYFAHANFSKIVVTYEAADHIKDKPEPINELKGQPFIFYIGRPHPHKNLKNLIDAYANLKKSRPDLKLVLAGKKDILYKQHEKYALDQGISGIVFTDFVSEGQLRWLYENCAAYVFPSLSEGFGLPGLEAMAHGAPVVASNASCLPEIYEGAAHYFDPLDLQDMTGAINEVLTNGKLRESLIKAGHEQVKKYSWARMAKQTLTIYERALGS